MPELHNFWFNDPKGGQNKLTMQPLPFDPVFLFLLLVFEMLACVLWFFIWTTLDQR